MESKDNFKISFDDDDNSNVYYHFPDIIIGINCTEY